MTLRDPQDWMWAEACELLERAERLHRQFFQLGSRPTHRPTWQPPADILETEGEVLILVALPGVAPADIAVLIDQTGLTVTGERHISVGSSGALIHRLEIPHGHFERHIALDIRRLELSRQEAFNGCLFLSFRKLS